MAIIDAEIPATTLQFEGPFLHQDVFTIYADLLDVGVEFSEAWAAGMTFNADILDAGVEFSESWAALRDVLAELSNILQFSELFELTGKFNVDVFDVYGFADYINYQFPTAAGWTLNVETDAPSRYDWPMYNSFAMLDGAAYGASEDGIFLLEGDDDEGEKIRWFLMTGKDALGSVFAKNVARGYLIAKFDGAIYLKTIVGGTDTTRTYRLVSTNDELLQRRLPLGKGPRAVRWQFALQDTNGQSLEADAFAVYPLLLTRRFP